MSPADLELPEAASPWRILLGLYGGHEWCERFANICLPSWLAEGNLPALNAKVALDIQVFIDERSEPLLAKYQITDRLQRYGRVETISIHDVQRKSPEHITISDCLQHGLTQAVPDGSGRYYLILSADTVYARGTFRQVLDYARRGYRGVLTTNLRSTESELRDRLARHRASDGVISLNNRDLTRLAIETLAPVSRSWIWKNHAFRHATAPMYLWPEGGSIIGLPFLRHPLMIHLTKPIRGLSGPVDYTVFEDAGISDELLMRVDSSDDISFVELVGTAIEHHLLVPDVYSVDKAASDILRWTRPLHWENGRHLFTFRSDQIGPSPGIIQQATGVQSEIYRRIAGHDHRAITASRNRRGRNTKLRLGSLRRLRQASLRAVLAAIGLTNGRVAVLFGRGSRTDLDGTGQPVSGNFRQEIVVDRDTSSQATIRQITESGFCQQVYDNIVLYNVALTEQSIAETLIFLEQYLARAGKIVYYNDFTAGLGQHLPAEAISPYRLLSCIPAPCMVTDFVYRPNDLQQATEALFQTACQKRALLLPVELMLRLFIAWQTFRLERGKTPKIYQLSLGWTKSPMVADGALASATREGTISATAGVGAVSGRARGSTPGFARIHFGRVLPQTVVVVAGCRPT